MVRYITAGDSHGKCLVVIVEDIPAGIKLVEGDINKELSRRQKGFGRSQRMQIEQDKAEIISGVYQENTTGAPICIMIENRDWQKNLSPLTKPRPGHADLPGAIKFSWKDLHAIQERASARETAARVAVGALCKKLLAELNIGIISFVTEICGIKIADTTLGNRGPIDAATINQIESSPVRCPDKAAEDKMIKLIQKANKEGDSIGGRIKLVAWNIVPGLGSFIQWDKKLDGRIAQALLSIQAVKGVEFGLGFNFSYKYGSEVSDNIFYNAKKGFYRKTNYAGGFEGGMTNGENIVINIVMKPIPTFRKMGHTVDIVTKKIVPAEYVRSDTCAVASCGVIAEAVLSIELVKVIEEKFGSDTLSEIKNRYEKYKKYVQKW